MKRAHPNLRNRLRFFEALDKGDRILTEVALELDVKDQAIRNLTSRMKDLGLVYATGRRIRGKKTRYYQLTERGRVDLERLRRELA